MGRRLSYTILAQRHAMSDTSSTSLLLLQDPCIFETEHHGHVRIS